MGVARWIQVFCLGNAISDKDEIIEQKDLSDWNVDWSGKGHDAGMWNRMPAWDCETRVSWNRGHPSYNQQCSPKFCNCGWEQSWKEHEWMYPDGTRIFTSTGGEDMMISHILWMQQKVRSCETSGQGDWSWLNGQGNIAAKNVNFVLWSKYRLDGGCRIPQGSGLLSCS